MGKTSIPYADESWSVVVGCDRPNCRNDRAGCDKCWAERLVSRLERMGYAPYAGLTRDGCWSGEVRTFPERLADPGHWRKPRRIFVAPMGDLFHRSVPDAFIDQVLDQVRFNLQHTFLLLTKQPRRMLLFADRLRPNLPLNILWGYSAWNQLSLNSGWQEVRQIPGRIWVSLEPLLGAVSLPSVLREWCPKHDSDSEFCVGPCTSRRMFSWVVAGGESGPGFRPDSLMWYRAILLACQRAGMPCYLKQRAGSREGLPLLMDGEESKDFPRERERKTC